MEISLFLKKINENVNFYEKKANYGNFLKKNYEKLVWENLLCYIGLDI